MHHRAQVAIQFGQEFCIVHVRSGLTLCEDAGYYRKTLLRAAHRFHDVAEERRMQVAEEAHEAPVGAPVEQDLGTLGLRRAALWLHRLAGLVAGLEVLAVEREAHAFFPRQHRVRLRAGGDEHRAGGQLHRRVVRLGELDGARMAILVHLDAHRGESLGEGDAFFQRLFHFLVVERVRRAVDEPAPVGDGRSAPGFQ